MIKWLKIDVMIDGDDKPPFFVGSMLRGAFGSALKRVVCINPSYRCEGCFATKECLYYRFYEEQNIFHPYRLGIKIQPKNYDFSLYLFEDAIPSLPYVLSAIKKAVEEHGFGKERKTMKIRQISISNMIVYDGKKFLSLENISTNKLIINSFSPNVELKFIMPLRIKENNRFAKNSVKLHTLINNIHMRYNQLKGNSPDKIAQRVKGEIVDTDMKFIEMRRYSNRQRKGMQIGGLKGIMTIEGLDPKSYEYLKIGEIIGVGKQTVFGLGSYIIKEKK